MDADYKKRILKELELFPLWKLKDTPNNELFPKQDTNSIEVDFVKTKNNKNVRVLYHKGSDTM